MKKNNDSRLLSPQVRNNIKTTPHVSDNEFNKPEKLRMKYNKSWLGN